MSSQPIEIRFDKRLNNLNLVQEANRGSRGEYFVVALLAVLMIFGLLAYGWQHYQFRDLEYRSAKASQTRIELQAKRETLRSEQQTLRGSERITDLARKFGLTGPRPGQVRPLPALEEAPGTPELTAQQQ